VHYYRESNNPYSSLTIFFAGDTIIPSWHTIVYVGSLNLSPDVVYRIALLAHVRCQSQSALLALATAESNQIISTPILVQEVDLDGASNIVEVFQLIHRTAHSPSCKGQVRYTPVTFTTCFTRSAYFMSIILMGGLFPWIPFLDDACILQPKNCCCDQATE